MPPLYVVEVLYIVLDRYVCLFPRGVALVVDQLALERPEEALGHGVIPRYRQR
jgi:hypothetical protein